MFVSGVSAVAISVGIAFDGPWPLLARGLSRPEALLEARGRNRYNPALKSAAPFVWFMDVSVVILSSRNQ